jgi:SAM-dependent methyltransferase
MSNLQVADRIAENTSSAAGIFQREWRLYRKIVDLNYCAHREVYGRLRRVLVEEIERPFRFLDLACGDAIGVVGALHGTDVVAYAGVDLSPEALRLASRALALLTCPVTLIEADFAEALGAWQEPIDVIWISLSLHHLRAPAKLETMRAACRLLGRRGMLLVYEHASPDSEDRDGWLRRWERTRPEWTGLTAEEWLRMDAHVRTYDFPETLSGWRDLGREAGFSVARELFVEPNNLLRLFAFQP